MFGGVKVSILNLSNLVPLSSMVVIVSASWSLLLKSKIGIQTDLLVNKKSQNDVLEQPHPYSLLQEKNQFKQAVKYPCRIMTKSLLMARKCRFTFKGVKHKMPCWKAENPPKKQLTSRTFSLIIPSPSLSKALNAPGRKKRTDIPSQTCITFALMQWFL